jgi:uncharacterized repeat protein (TIGR03899 family)
MSVADMITAANAPIIKLIEAVAGATGRVYEPRHKRKMADAEAYEIKQIAEAIRDNSDLPIVYTGDKLSIDAHNFEELKKRAIGRLSYQEIRKQFNIENVVDMAYDELLTVGTPEDISEQPVDADWMMRFINSIEDVSNEEMQIIWAKILAGEVQKPGSFSVRTLECLRNLSTREARIFQRILPYAMIKDNTMFIYDGVNNGNFEEYGIELFDLMLLNECSLVWPNVITLNIIIEPYERNVALFSNSSLVCLAENPTDTDIRLSWPNYPLTSAGKELALALNVAANEEYSLKIMMAFAKEYNDNTAEIVSIHKVIGHADSEIIYQKEAIPLG